MTIADGASILSVAGRTPQLAPDSFVASGAVQCGFCTPGLVVQVHALLQHNPSPSDAEIREWLAGNLCRCTGYEKIMDAVRLAARQVADG